MYNTLEKRLQAKKGILLMAMPDKDHKGSGLTFYRLTQEDIDTIMSGLGHYREMSVQEAKECMNKALGGRSLSDLLIEMRSGESDNGGC